MLKEKISNLKRIENAKKSNALVREIIKNATDEIKVELLAEFREYIDWCKIGDFPDNPIFGIQMFIIFKELEMKEAFDLVVEYLQLDYEILDTELDDFLLEIAYEVISVLGDDRVEEIKRIIKDKTVNNYVRGTFSSTLAFLTYIEKTDRESTKEFYKEIFEDKNEDLELKYYMTDDLEKLGLKEFRDVIKKVEVQYENVLPWDVSEPRFDSSKFEYTKNTQEPLQEYLRFYETEDETSNFIWSEDENFFDEYRESTDYYDLDYQQPRTTIKIGRNEPCPCGSGKKYKKCCGK